MHRQDHDFAVAHASGASDFDDHPHDLVYPCVVYPDRNFDFGKERHRVLAVAVLVEVALLPPVAFDFANRQSLKGRSFQPFEYLFGQKWFNDSYDLFHKAQVS